jgi:hypothetical protein
MNQREMNLRELYRTIKAMRTVPQGKRVIPLSGRQRELLKQYTKFDSLPLKKKGVFITAIMYGAELDEEGRLIINSPEAREKLASMKATALLQERQDLISPKTENASAIFRNLRRSGQKPIKSNITRGESPGAIKGRTGRWPHGRRGVNPYLR